MTICEYCGRVHHLTQPDPRFCSILCRTQYTQYRTPWLKSSVTAQDIRLTQADWLAAHIIEITEDARRLLATTLVLATDPQLSDLHTFLLSLAEEVSVAQDIQQYMATHTVESPS